MRQTCDIMPMKKQNVIDLQINNFFLNENVLLVIIMNSVSPLIFIDWVYDIKVISRTYQYLKNSFVQIIGLNYISVYLQEFQITCISITFTIHH